MMPSSTVRAHAPPARALAPRENTAAPSERGSSGAPRGSHVARGPVRRRREPVRTRRHRLASQIHQVPPGPGGPTRPRATLGGENAGGAPAPTTWPRKLQRGTRTTRGSDAATRKPDHGTPPRRPALPRTATAPPSLPCRGRPVARRTHPPRTSPADAADLLRRRIVAPRADFRRLRVAETRCCRRGLRGGPL